MRWIVAIFWLMPLLVSAQEPILNHSVSSTFSTTIAKFSNVEGSTVFSTKKLEEILAKEKAKRSKNSRSLLNSVFTKTHSKLLKTYSEYPTFTEIFTSGNYNCLTATALYSAILDELEFKYKVVETNYHIFMMVETAEGDVLIETTDPIHGFVTDKSEIEQRISKYMADDRQNNKSYYQYAMTLYNHIDPQSITGLLHYNLAVELYNQKKFSATIEHIEKAQGYYYSKRLEEFARVVLLSVVESDLHFTQKEILVRKLQSIRKNAPAPSVVSAKSF
jgi:hypothetical protein